MTVLRRAFLILTSAVHVATAVGLIRHRKPGRDDIDGSFVKRVDFKHRLRVCNAYPLKGAMDVYVDGSKRLTESTPLPYKACRDFTTSLNAGDKLDFKVGDATTGTFSIANLPSSDAILLLVIHRHDEKSTSVAFESHVYSNLASAQVAVIDTYKGKAVATPRIQDNGVASKGSARSEELRYNSVVAVNEGAYSVVLDDTSGKRKAKGQLVAVNKECYVVMRTGVEAVAGQESFPEELVVFPQSTPQQLHSGAAIFGTSSTALIAMLIACWTLVA